jgi:hypothetical protein
MICHIVLYQLKPGINEKQRGQLLNDARQKLAKVRGVKALRVGTNIVKGDSAFAVGLYMEFDDESALQRYRVDADHQAFVRECVDPVVLKIERFDFKAE